MTLQKINKTLSKHDGGGGTEYDLLKNILAMVSATVAVSVIAENFTTVPNLVSAVQSGIERFFWTKISTWQVLHWPIIA